MALSLATRHDRGWTIVSLTGEIDVATAPRLREYLSGARPAEAGMIVDLTRVDFLDSAGLGVLVGALKRARARGETLQLVCPRHRIREVFTVTGLTRMFRIHDSIDGVARGRRLPPDHPPGVG